MASVVVGIPVSTPPAGLGYTYVCAGALTTYLIRSDGSVDRVRSGGNACQRMVPPENCKYVSASAGTTSSYLLRDDGQVDRVKGGAEASVVETIAPQGYPKVRYTTVSNSMGPCYLLRSDGMLDMHKEGKPIKTMEGEYAALSGGTEDSYHLKVNGTIDKVNSGKVSSTFTAEPPAKYVGVATQCIMIQNQYGAGHLSALYCVRDDGKLDRLTGIKSCTTMEPPAGITWVAVSSADTASYLLRSDGAVDRTVCFGKIDVTMNPPPGQTYVQVYAGQHTSYLLRSDGKVDITKGSGKVDKTIDADMDLKKEVNCIVM